MMTVDAGHNFTKWRECEELAQTGGRGIWAVDQGDIEPGTWEGSLFCEAECGMRAGVIAMQVGRAIAGFFGGTRPVLRSWLLHVSAQNPDNMKKRLVMMQSSSMVAPVTLAPVAGALALLGLHLPWLVSSGFAIALLLYTMVFFKDSTHFVAAQANPSEQPASSEQHGDAPKRPIADPVLHAFCAIYITFIIGVSGLQLLTPLTLEQHSFGLIDVIGKPDTEECRERNWYRRDSEWCSWLVDIDHLLYLGQQADWRQEHNAFGLLDRCASNHVYWLLRREVVAAGNHSSSVWCRCWLLCTGYLPNDSRLCR
jgi:hypothetical protein